MTENQEKINNLKDEKLDVTAEIRRLENSKTEILYGIYRVVAKVTCSDPIPPWDGLSDGVKRTFTELPVSALLSTHVELSPALSMVKKANEDLIAVIQTMRFRIDAIEREIRTLEPTVLEIPEEGNLQAPYS